METESQSLFEQVWSFENVLHAYQKARRGKRLQDDVAAFDFHLEHHLIQLRNQLRDHTYRPGQYRQFTVLDPKERHISAAPFRDRVVHHALCNVRATLAGYEAMIHAGSVSDAALVKGYLDEGAAQLNLMRMYLRLSHTLTCITTKQYEYASERFTEVGRLLQAWRTKIPMKPGTDISTQANG